MPFYCSDTSCPAKTSYNKLTKIFTIKDTEHIDYEKHNNIIPTILKEKYKNNEFIENDFKDNLR